MKHKPLPLTEEEILKLKEIVRKGNDWRSRDRAETLLRLARSDSPNVVAEAQGVCTQTVNERRQQWLNKGFAGLIDAPRSGAPGKLSAYLPMIEEWAQTSPLSAGEIHQRLIEEFDVRVHLNTVRCTKLLHGEENVVCADAGYTGVEKRPEHEGRQVIWQIAARRSTYEKHGKRSVLYKALRKIERAKAQVRAKVEHPFRVIKRQFGYTKVRFRGLAKNAAQMVTLFALSNLWMARRHLLAGAGEVRL